MRGVTALAVWMLLAFPVCADAVERITSPGDFFPDYSFSTDLSTADTAYLGLSADVAQKGSFGIGDIWGNLVVLELFNRYCFGCQQGAPIINRAYELIASDPALSTEVRFMGVGVGNNDKVVREFREEFDVPFPLIADPKFGLLKALGNPGGTPYTVLVRRTSRGMVVVDTHFGVLDAAEHLLDRVREVLSEDLERILAEAKPAEVAQWVEKELVPPLTEDEILDRVEASMKRAGYGSVGLHSVELPSGDRLFVGESKRGKVFARLISRLPICDVCHPIHFILTFDTRALVVDFDPVFVTKYWNKPWNEEEVAFMRKKLLGLSVLEERDFDPEVDAVSTATMSSTLIFDSLERTGEIMRILEEEGYLQ
ncbi:MAG: hypothetical protein JSV26_08150 [bacterium]|nr:MAG: hypothetical protein JSV26_08150 [bacterium]